MSASSMEFSSELPATEAIHAGTLDLDNRSLLSIVRAIHGEDLRAACAVGMTSSCGRHACGPASPRCPARGRCLVQHGRRHQRAPRLSRRGRAAAHLRCRTRSRAGRSRRWTRRRCSVPSKEPRTMNSRPVAISKSARSAADDALVAISASGRTPYTVAGLRLRKTLRRTHHWTHLRSALPARRGGRSRHRHRSGPRGHRRFDAHEGRQSPRKMVLHQLSTAVMVRMGRVSGNLMSHVRPASQKVEAPRGTDSPGASAASS